MKGVCDSVRSGITLSCIGLAAVAVFSGCAKDRTVVKVTRLNPGPEVSETKAVTVYPAGKPGPANYEVLGVVNGYWDIPGTTLFEVKARDKAALQAMQTEAAALGADALLEYYADLEVDTLVLSRSLHTALAARTLPSAEKGAAPKLNCVVAMPHVLFGDGVSSKKAAEKIDSMVRRYTRFYLAEKGYYLTLSDATVPAPFESTLTAMSEAELAQYGGPEADLVLGVQFAKKESTIVLVSKVTTTLELTLYSKSQKKAIWHGTASGEASNTWHYDIMGSGLKQKEAIQRTLRTAFISLPGVSTKTKQPGR
jgi:hypothetical protein